MCFSSKGEQIRISVSKGCEKIDESKKARNAIFAWHTEVEKSEAFEVAFPTLSKPKQGQKSSLIALMGNRCLASVVQAQKSSLIGTGPDGYKVLELAKLDDEDRCLVADVKKLIRTESFQRRR